MRWTEGEYLLWKWSWLWRGMLKVSLERGIKVCPLPSNHHDCWEAFDWSYGVECTSFSSCVCGLSLLAFCSVLHQKHHHTYYIFYCHCPGFLLMMLFFSLLSFPSSDLSSFLSLEIPWHIPQTMFVTRLLVFTWIHASNRKSYRWSFDVSSMRKKYLSSFFSRE